MLDFSNEINFLEPNIQVDFNNLDKENFKYKDLLKQLEKKYRISKNKIELFNGFSSAIYSLLKYLSLKYCYIYSPCNLEYKKASLDLNYELKFINRFEDIYLPIKKKSLVIFSNPAYLDGTYYELEKLLKYWKEQNASIILDESLVDFCKNSSYINLLEEYDNLFIIKDMSKFYGKKSLNIATVFSKYENIKNLRKSEAQNKISKYDGKYLLEALKDESFSYISKCVYIKNKIEIEKIFENSSYVQLLFQSSSNSILIKLKKSYLKSFKEILKNNDVSIHSCLGYDFLDESFICFHINSLNKIKELKKILNAF